MYAIASGELTFMPGQTIHRLHRVMVDWVADTFGLDGDAAANHAHVHAEARARARTWAYALNRREMRHHEPREPREPRVLKRWQAMIGRAAASR
jgi:hypothetical protein